MLQCDNFSFLKARAESPLTMADELFELAANPDRFVRMFVAKNPRTPERLLASLSFDEHWSVRYAVAANENTPKEVLMRLAVDDDARVCQGVDENEILTERDREEIACIRKAHRRK